MLKQFVYIFFPIANKSQLTPSLYKDILKIFYNDYGKSVSITTKFSLKKYFFCLLIFIDEKFL